MFAMSLSSLIWGVLADYYGRKPIATFGLGAFVLSSAGCYFSPSIAVFLVYRALQGLLISVTVVLGQGTIADVYQPNDRGSAYGIFYAFYFAAAISAPVIGGQVSHHYGWRSTFIFVTIISFVVFIGYVLIVPETQQYKVIRTYENQWNIILLESDQVSKPTLTNPCLPLLYVSDSKIIPYMVLLICGYVAINCCVLLLSTELAAPPYSFHEDSISMLYIPMGIGLLFGSIIGGKLSDLVAVKYFQTSKILEGRIVPALIFSVFTTVGLIIYGWSIQYGIHVSVPLLGQIIGTIGQAATRPGILSYFTIKYQEHSASIISATNFLQTLLTSIVLIFTRQIVQAIHDGPFFTILAVCNLLSTIFAALIIFRKVRLSINPEKKLLL
jgi:multidrug resistance protein